VRRVEGFKLAPQPARGLATVRSSVGDESVVDGFGHAPPDTANERTFTVSVWSFSARAAVALVATSRSFLGGLPVLVVRQPQDHTAVANARPAQGAQAVDDLRRQPDQTLALPVDLRLDGDGAEPHLALIASKAAGVMAVRIIFQCAHSFERSRRLW
jgi:hypothetical protein